MNIAADEAIDKLIRRNWVQIGEIAFRCIYYEWRG
jgi:hypothetical protein